MGIIKVDLLGFGMMAVLHDATPQRFWKIADVAWIDQSRAPGLWTFACSICFRKLKGRMSVHTSLIYPKHSDLIPVLPDFLHPAGTSR
jgi:hypothetical protein